MVLFPYVTYFILALCPDVTFMMWVLSDVTYVLLAVCPVVTYLRLTLRPDVTVHLFDNLLGYPI